MPANAQPPQPTPPPHDPSVAVGLALGAALAPAAPPWFRRHVVAATGLGNVGNLPLVLVAALVHEAGGSLGQVRFYAGPCAPHPPGLVPFHGSRFWASMGQGLLGRGGRAHCAECCHDGGHPPTRPELPEAAGGGGAQILGAWRWDGRKPGSGCLLTSAGLLTSSATASPPLGTTPLPKFSIAVICDVFTSRTSDGLPAEPVHDAHSRLH
jgi:hypothetical protein